MEPYFSIQLRRPEKNRPRRPMMVCTEQWRNRTNTDVFVKPFGKITALKLSVQKWETIRAFHDGVDRGELHPDKVVNTSILHIGTEHCALCYNYYEKNCAGCPIREDSGRTCCVDTPVSEYYRAAEWEMGGHLLLANKAHHVVDYLQRLLAEEQQKQRKKRRARVL